MNRAIENFKIATDGLQITARFVPWDTEVYGFPVAQVENFKLFDTVAALRDYVQFRQWLCDNSIKIVSCRLPHNCLRESIFLESKGFRFIEMVLHPRIEKLQRIEIPQDDLKICPALASDITTLRAIAEKAFHHERYHVDPRLDPRFADMRYGRWVQSSVNHSYQCLLKVMLDENIIALFIIENGHENAVYWHLTAIAPGWQGRGCGKRIWRAMLHYHKGEGKDSVTTTISARNVAVLNLYSKLDFRFLPPEMTFHWINDA